MLSARSTTRGIAAAVGSSAPLARWTAACASRPAMPASTSPATKPCCLAASRPLAPSPPTAAWAVGSTTCTITSSALPACRPTLAALTSPPGPALSTSTRPTALRRARASATRASRNAWRRAASSRRASATTGSSPTTPPPRISKSSGQRCTKAGRWPSASMPAAPSWLTPRASSAWTVATARTMPCMPSVGDRGTSWGRTLGAICGATAAASRSRLACHPTSRSRGILRRPSTRCPYLRARGPRPPRRRSRRRTLPPSPATLTRTDVGRARIGPRSMACPKSASSASHLARSM
mmetsp:Transcript_115716/g.332395  ORF Transcript_115716/g.332395 Transcript_115716/m.332395 type:complete len:294 (-) Transcript_115716:392-1273(-)